MVRAGLDHSGKTLVGLPGSRSFRCARRVRTAERHVNLSYLLKRTMGNTLLNMAIILVAVIIGDHFFNDGELLTFAVRELRHFL
jgi:hypothetical protein